MKRYRLVQRDKYEGFGAAEPDDRSVLSRTGPLIFCNVPSAAPWLKAVRDERAACSSSSSIS